MKGLTGIIGPALLVAMAASSPTCAGQGSDSVNPELLPAGAHATIETMNVADVPVRDVIRAIAEEYELNVVVDQNVRAHTTIRLSSIGVLEAISFLCEQYDLLLSQSGPILKVSPRPQFVPEPEPVDVRFEDGLLSAQLDGVPLDRFVHALQNAAGMSIVIASGVVGDLSGYLNQVDVTEGLRSLLQYNGLSLQLEGDVMVVVEPDKPSGASGRRVLEVDASTFESDQAGTLVSIRAENVTAADVLRSLRSEAAVSIAIHDDPVEYVVNLNLNAVEIENALESLLLGSPYGFAQIGNGFAVAKRESAHLRGTRLLRLQHARAKDLVEFLPAQTDGSSVEVVPGLNAILLNGTMDQVRATQQIVEMLDISTPQILIEALVVDFETTDLKELGVTLARGDIDDSSLSSRFSIFGAGADQSGGLIYQGDGAEANSFLDYWGDLLGVGVGRLPTDFLFRIRALERAGKAKVRSRPQVATINGSTARIAIGTTQYFILTSTTPLQSPNQIVTQESQRFESIEANVELEITPWVTAAGEVTVEVHPEFSTPVGQLSPGVPPTINTRVLDSTVRLRDGETIILGGLIQETEVVVHNKVPILGSIPLLGRLFRNKRTEKVRSELVIYITPHVFYGDETDGDRWHDLSRRQQLKATDGVTFRGPEAPDASAVDSLQIQRVRDVVPNAPASTDSTRTRSDLLP